MGMNECLQTACNVAQKAALDAQTARDSLPVSLNTSDVLVKRDTIGANIDLNIYGVMGIYHQPSNYNATNGANYPVALAGVLTVKTEGLIIFQEYRDYQNNGVYTRVSYGGTWTTWKNVNVLKTGAILQNGWSNYSSTAGSFAQATYRKEKGIVYIEGLVKGGTIGTAIFTLPPNCRPSGHLILPIISNNVFGKMTVNLLGGVVADVGSNVWFSINCSFYVGD